MEERLTNIKAELTSARAIWCHHCWKFPLPKTDKSLSMLAKRIGESSQEIANLCEDLKQEPRSKRQKQDE